MSDDPLAEQLAAELTRAQQVAAANERVAHATARATLAAHRAMVAAVIAVVAGSVGVGFVLRGILDAMGS